MSKKTEIILLMILAALFFFAVAAQHGDALKVGAERIDTRYP